VRARAFTTGPPAAIDSTRAVDSGRTHQANAVESRTGADGKTPA
jgi:hypothetical protein